MSQKHDLEDAREIYFTMGGIESDIGARNNPSWYWRRAMTLLQEQVKSLQANNTKIVLEIQKRHRHVMLTEELHRVITRLSNRVVLAERIAEKLWNDCDSTTLTEAECYVLEEIGHREHKNAEATELITQALKIIKENNIPRSPGAAPEDEPVNTLNEVEEILERAHPDV